MCFCSLIPSWSREVKAIWVLSNTQVLGPIELSSSEAIPVDRMSEIIPYIQRCQKYLLHCPAYSLRNDIHLWLLSGAHLWVSPPLTTHQSQFQIFIFHTFRLPPVSTKANHPSAQDSQLQHPSMYTSTEPFYKAYAILIHKAMVLTAIVPLPSHEPGQLLERLRCFKTQRRSLFQRRPFKKSPFQVAEKKKDATSSKQIQGTWCFGLNGHRREPIRWWFCARTV